MKKEDMVVPSIKPNEDRDRRNRTRIKKNPENEKERQAQLQKTTEEDLNDNYVLNIKQNIPLFQMTTG